MKALCLVLVLAVASRLHVTVTAYGVLLSVPLLWFAAAIVAVPLATLMLAGRQALARNRCPRFCWQSVTA